MNKYSSKAIKTAATVGMSLAMVLSSAAPVFAEEGVEPVVEVTIKDLIDQKDDVTDLLDLLGDAKNLAPSDVVISEGNKDFVTVLTENKEMLENAYKYASVVGYTTEQTEILKYLVGTKVGDDVKTAIAFASDLLGTLPDLEGYDGTVNSTYIALYNKVSALLDFKGNIPNDKTDDLEQIEDLFADLESDVEDYKEDNVANDAKKFATALAGTTATTGKTVGELVDDEVAIPYTSLSSLNAFITKVTKDSYKLGDVKYGDVKNEDVVADYIEGLETIAAEMKEVKDLIDDTKSEKRAFDKSAMKTLVGNLATAAETDADDNALDAIESAIDAFRASDVKVVKDFVDNFVNEFWTVTTEQRTSGSYRVRTLDAGLGRYYAFEDVAGADLLKIMTTLVDSDEEETFYDLLIADAASTDELLKAVTTNIEGITMSSTLTDKQAAKIISARKALAKLDAKKANGSTIYDSLSRSEKADVDANRELIDALYFKLILNGNVTASGWVDKGNGEWDYIAEDGSRPTKWVASGANWYYVKNGTMLRNSWIASDAQGTRWYYVDDAGVMVSNTTVNGYTFNSYGVWVK